MTLGEYAAMTASELRKMHGSRKSGALFSVTNRHLSECGVSKTERKWFWEEVARNWRLQTELAQDPPQGDRLQRELDERVAEIARAVVAAGEW